MVDVTKMTPLEREFHDGSIKESEILKTQHGYNPTFFLQMVYEHGGVEAARKLLKSPNYQAGLITLWEKKLLRMSVEAAALRPHWSSLFTDAEKAEARKRLKALEYDPLTDKYGAAK